MNQKYISENEKEMKETRDDRLNFKLSLRKKEYNKKIYNKRKIFFENSNLLKENKSNSSKYDENLLENNNIFKVISKEQILEKIKKLQNKNTSIYNNITEISQCFLSLYSYMNQNLIDSLKFIDYNKIYIFLIDFIENIFNTPYTQDINTIHNNIELLIYKALELLFKYSSYKDNNNEMIKYLISDNKINIFNQILSSIINKGNSKQNKIIINGSKKTNILLFSIILLHNFSVESSELFNVIQNIKFDEKLIIFINDKNNNLNINDDNINYIIQYFSLSLLDKNIINKDENYIINICEFLNKKGIISLNLKAQELSLFCLSNITALYESNKLYNKMIYSGIFDNIFQIIKTSNIMYYIIAALNIVNNILNEKNIDLNYFLKSDLLKGLMELIINYEKHKNNITPKLLHYIISIFLYLTKSPIFYSLINNNLNFIVVLVELIGKISTEVTHDILTFIKDIINESYKISQLIIYNNKELIMKLIDIIKENSHNNKIPTMSAFILFQITKYYYYDNSIEENENSKFKFKEYAIQIKEIIELKLLNENSINENLKRIFKEILKIMEEKKEI